MGSIKIKTVNIIAIISLLIYLVLILVSCSDKQTNPITVKTLKELNISTDSIYLNPYGYAPLSAIIKYSSSDQGKTRITVLGKNGINSNISNQFNDFGNSHSVSILGLYPDFENTVQIELIDKSNNTIASTYIKIKTFPLPRSMPTSIIIKINQTDKEESGLNLISNYSSTAPHIPLFVDSYGDIRWYLDFKNHPDLKDLAYEDGIFRLSNGNFCFGDAFSNKIYEVNELGKIINNWKFDGYTFHHNVVEKPDGNFLLSVSKHGSSDLIGNQTSEDYIIEINRISGSVINEWDLKVCLDENRHTLVYNPYDWIHVNAVIYDPSDNTIIVSARHQGVIKLTYDNRVKWILGPHLGWGVNRRGEDLNQFLLTPLDNNGNVISDTSVAIGYTNHPYFEWNWFQHSTILIPNGNLMMFDNGDIRNFNNYPTSIYSRVVEYQINDKNMTVQQKWTYGKERGLETFSRVVSNVQFLEKSNHVLFCPGYDVLNVDGNGGKVIELDYKTKEVLFEMSFTTQNSWGFHRTYRDNIYFQNKVSNNQTH